jgi:hypothetical protein
MTRHPLRATLAFALFPLAACTAFSPPEPIGPLAKEEVLAVTASNQLLRFNAGQPQLVRDRRPITGLAPGERLVGLDFRVARGELYALGASGQLYRIDAARGAATAVGSAAALPAEAQGDWGFDFNPAVDRIRVVAASGQNLRLHPDTGAAIDADPQRPGLQADATLAFDTGDRHAGRPVRIVAAAYTYNKQDEKITTNYALDGAAGLLVHQGTKEGVAPAVSPNTGRLFTTGALGTGPFAQAVFDIADVSNAAYAGLRAEGARSTRWHRIDLASGRATFVGTVGGGEPLVGAAIEP